MRKIFESFFKCSRKKHQSLGWNWLSVTPWSVSSVFVLVSTPLQVSSIFPVIPQCIYTCVLCLSVAGLFCFVKSTIVLPLAPGCSSSGFLVFPWFAHSACPEPACRSVPCNTTLDYWTLPALTLRLPTVLDLLDPIWITDLCLPLACRFACTSNKLLFLPHCLHLGLTWNVILSWGPPQELKTQSYPCCRGYIRVNCTSDCSPNKCFRVQVTDRSQHQMFRGESDLHGRIAETTTKGHQ
jgi:hypothetical protein